ncbi:hypothetical protein ACROYT_G015447 [Oculina patagonica]
MPAAPSLPEMETQMLTPPSSPMIRDQLMSTPESSKQGRSRGKQFDSVTEADKSTIETVLFLMDKFAVGDAFIHELSMVFDGMPKSYLIKQCRDKLNSTCSVKPIPGGQCGAQVSFKESLINKLKQLISSANDESELAKSIREEADFLFECGISKLAWPFSEKENLKSMLCKSSEIYRAKAALDQFVEGLQKVGLLSYIKKYHGVLREVFCYAPTPLCVTDFKNLLNITFSVPGSNASNDAREGEEATILWWEEFLDRLTRSDPEGLLPKLLIFITVVDNIPILGVPKNIDIDFFNYQPGIRWFTLNDAKRHTLL